MNRQGKALAREETCKFNVKGLWPKVREAQKGGKILFCI